MKTERRTCGGCDQVVKEAWKPGRVSFHCGAPGPRKGYMVGNDRPLPYIPVWCPKGKGVGKK